MKSTDPDNPDNLPQIFHDWCDAGLAGGEGPNWPEGYENEIKMKSFFEHGQWFVEDIGSGACWSVQDAEGVGTLHGYCFENITEGDFTAFQNEQATQAEG